MVAPGFDFSEGVYEPMSDLPPPTPEDEDDFLAAELALGLAEGDDLTRAQDRVRRDAIFAAQVAAWHERLIVLADSIAPVTPHKRVKKALLASLFPKIRVPLMQRLWVWQGISFAAIALLAYITVPMLRPPVPTPQGAPQVFATQLTGDVDDLTVLAVLDPARGDIALRRTAGAAPAGRVLELWAILPEQAPISLGVLPADAVARVALPAELAAQVAQITLAISDEPPGGAPAGAPTGAVRAVGAVSEL